MATQTKYAQSNAAITTGWTNPTYAYADDTGFASCAISSKNTSVVSDYYNFGFTIPTDATINSITIEAHYYSNTTGSTGAYIAIQTILNTTLRGTQKQGSMSTSETDISSTDNGTWSVSEINDNTQAGGFKIRLTGRRSSSNTAITWYCDYVRATVDYKVDKVVTQASAATTSATHLSPTIFKTKNPKIIQGNAGRTTTNSLEPTISKSRLIIPPIIKGTTSTKVPAIMKIKIITQTKGLSTAKGLSPIIRRSKTINHTIGSSNVLFVKPLQNCFEIQRKAEVGGTWATIVVLKSSTYTEYNDVGPFDSGVSYYYRVRKTIADVVGDWSNEDIVIYQLAATVVNAKICSTSSLFNNPGVVAHRNKIITQTSSAQCSAQTRIHTIKATIFSSTPAKIFTGMANANTPAIYTTWNVLIALLIAMSSGTGTPPSVYTTKSRSISGSVADAAADSVAPTINTSSSVTISGTIATATASGIESTILIIKNTTITIPFENNGYVIGQSASPTIYTTKNVNILQTKILTSATINNPNIFTTRSIIIAPPTIKNNKINTKMVKPTAIKGNYWQIGDNVFALLDQTTHQLTISGTGATYSDMIVSPFSVNREYITSVIVEEGITYLGDNNFCGLFSGTSTITSVILPQSLTGIGDYTFTLVGNPGISTIIIPSQVNYIGYSAFESCYDLQYIYNYYNGDQTIKFAGFKDCGTDISPKYAYCYSSNTSFITAATTAGYTIIYIVDTSINIPIINTDASLNNPTIVTESQIDAIITIGTSAQSSALLNNPNIYSETTTIILQENGISTLVKMLFPTIIGQKNISLSIPIISADGAINSPTIHKSNIVEIGKIVGFSAILIPTIHKSKNILIPIGQATGQIISPTIKHSKIIPSPVAETNGIMVNPNLKLSKIISISTIGNAIAITISPTIHKSKTIDVEVGQCNANILSPVSYTTSNISITIGKIITQATMKVPSMGGISNAVIEHTKSLTNARVLSPTIIVSGAVSTPIANALTNTLNPKIIINNVVVVPTIITNALFNKPQIGSTGNTSISSTTIKTDVSINSPVIYTTKNASIVIIKTNANGLMLPPHIFVNCIIIIPKILTSAKFNNPNLAISEIVHQTIAYASTNLLSPTFKLSKVISVLSTVASAEMKKPVIGGGNAFSVPTMRAITTINKPTIFTARNKTIIATITNSSVRMVKPTVGATINALIVTTKGITNANMLYPSIVINSIINGKAAAGFAIFNKPSLLATKNTSILSTISNGSTIIINPTIEKSTIINIPISDIIGVINNPIISTTIVTIINVPIADADVMFARPSFPGYATIHIGIIISSATLKSPIIRLINPISVVGVRFVKQIKSKTKTVAYTSNYTKSRTIKDKQTEANIVSKQKSVIYDKIDKSI